MGKAVLKILLILNIMVLLGQLWPAGAPPFAGIVNIVFLVGSLIFFTFLLLKKLK
jgi:hypothetical protein